MKILLVIDLQKEFKDNLGQYEKCLSYIGEHRSEYDQIIATVFRQDRLENSNYSRKLKWDGCEDADYNSIEFKADPIIIKHGYSCYPELLFAEKDEIYVMGCDSDACVLAICFGLWDAGFDFHVLTDYIYTTGNINQEEVLKIMKRNFGDVFVEEPIMKKSFWDKLKAFFTENKA